MLKIIGGIFAVFVVLMVIGMSIPGDRESHGSTPYSVDAKSGAPENWHYSDDFDEIHSRRVAYACTTSEEGYEWCFRRTNGRLDTYITAPGSSGAAFYCYEDHCSTTVRFGTAAPIQVSGVNTDNGDPRTMFLLSTSTLIARTRSADTVLMQPPLFQRDTILHFHVSGLNLEKLR